MGFEDELERVINQTREKQAIWEKEVAEMRKKSFATICVHGAYTPEEALRNNSGAMIEPVYSSSAQAFENAYWLEAALSYKIPSWVYSRIANPTIGYLELVLAMLESYHQPINASAFCTSSGMSAVKTATEPFLVNLRGGGNGEKKNLVSMAQCYGGTFQLFNERYRRERGIEVRWIEDPANASEWEEKIDENTRFIYGEMPSNPGLMIFDVEPVAEIAHKHGVPLIIDSTVATPALMRPFEHGADIIVHSLTKSITASGRVIGGALVSRENIVWKAAPDDQIRHDFAGWVKLWPARDAGPCMSAETAAHSLDSLKTLRMRMDCMSRSTMEVAEFLEAHTMVESVNYLGLENHPLHALAKKYLKLVDSDENRYGHLLSFTVKGGLENTRLVFNRLRMIFRATDLGRIKSVATIPSVSTHQQQGEEGRRLAKIPANMIRLSIGAEDVRDIINELDSALGAVH